MSANVSFRAMWSLGIAVWLLGAGSAAAAPRATAAADSFPNAPDVLLWPAHPCPQDDAVFYVRGFRPTPCDSFLGAFASGDRQIVIRTLVQVDRQCAVAPTDFYAVPVPMGRFPAGSQTITIQRHLLSLTQAGALDSTVTSTELSFDVAGSCPDPPLPVPAASLPYVSAVTTIPSPACPDRPTVVHFDGHIDACGRLVSASLDGAIQLVLAPFPPDPRPCPALVMPWNASVSVGFVLPGTHAALVREKVLGTNAIWPPIFDQSYEGLFDFTVADQCDSLPAYPFQVWVTPEIRSGLICENSPIRVNLAGYLPNSCWSVRRVLLVPGQPTPAVRVVLDDGGCTERICPNVPVFWDTSMVVPGLPRGVYEQEGQVGFVTCSDSIPPDSLFIRRVSFQVFPPESCGVAPPPSAACLLPAWSPIATKAGTCDAYLSPDGTASLTFQIASGVALSGLQGEFNFHHPGLMIDSLVTDGPAVGMRLAWSRTPTGARFVMFAEHGAPIPPGWAPNVPGMHSVPVLRVSVGPAFIRANVPWPADGFDLEADHILGSDIEGREVPPCPTFAFAPVIAHLCFERPCDFDGNGVADVRDLVRMVHCVNGDGPCPVDPVTSFDCDGNNLFDLSDVLCCAVHLLRGPDCPDCPIDSTRDEPTVKASFGDPIVTAAGVDVPLHLEGADRIGAARLGLRFPSDRFTFIGAEAHTASWLELHQAGEGQASVGLIRIGPSIEVGPGTELDLLLHLALRSGASRGGAISLASQEMSGTDGKMLRVDLGTAPRSLDGRAALAITSIRPNPSSGVFRITVRLTAPAAVDVAVHDLAGRRIATLFHGDQPAGTNELVWDGSSTAGGIRGGVYFVRASVRGQATVKKLILLGNPPGSGGITPVR